MKKVTAFLAALPFVLSLAFNSTTLAKETSEEEVQCSVCHGQTCVVHHLEAGMVPAFLYATGKKLAEKGVKDWSFECSTKEKKISGQFHLEEITEK